MATNNEGGGADQRTCLSVDEVSALLTNGHPQYTWYEREAARMERWLAGVTWCGIVAGFTASALAAYPVSSMDKYSQEISRWFIAILTLLVTLFSGTLASRYRRLASDREKGRIETLYLLNVTKVRLLHEPMTPLERGRVLANFEKGILDVELARGTAEGVHTQADSSDHK